MARRPNLATAGFVGRRRLDAGDGRLDQDGPFGVLAARPALDKVSSHPYRECRIRLTVAVRLDALAEPVMLKPVHELEILARSPSH